MKDFRKISKSDWRAVMKIRLITARDIVARKDLKLSKILSWTWIGSKKHRKIKNSRGRTLNKEHSIRF